MSESLEMEVETQDGAGNRDEGKRLEEHPASSSSSPSESDSEGDDDDGEDSKVETLEEKLSQNPLSYDDHVQYIRALRKLGHLEKLRKARESMNALFPLSPTMWREWAKDETSLSTGPESLAAVEKLYERGVQEYLSAPLWCDYVNFVQEHDQSVSQCTADGILKMRDLFERAVTAVGLHVVEGGSIWEAYREFEQAILLTIDDSSIEERGKQIDRIRSLFHRQLSVPHSNSKSTLQAYKQWEAEQGNSDRLDSDELDGLPSHVVSTYQKALQMYNARVGYEDQLSSTGTYDVDKLQIFLNYVKFEQSSGDPVRVQILYERAVTEFPVSSDLWLSYTRYLDRTLKVPSVLRSVYSRATRNCPWVGELLVRYLLCLERICASEEELSAVFDKSLQCTFLSLEEEISALENICAALVLAGHRISMKLTMACWYLDFFLTRIDGLRRRISSATSTEDGLDYVVIRDTFKHATEYLSPHLKDSNSLLRLHSYWARLEFNLGKDLAAARGVWESLIKISGSMLEVWQSYIAMEIELGHINEARSIYKRCYSKRFLGTGSEDICYSWLRFEREFGTLEDFDHAERKVRPRLEELKLFRSQQESKPAAAAAAAHKENTFSKKASQKRKASSRSTDEQPSAKRQKDTSKKMEEVENKSGQRDTTQRSTESNDIGSVKSRASASLAEAPGSITTNEKHVGDSPSKEAKLLYTDQCTVFISNISPQAKEEHLQDFFSDVGGVTAIRLLRDKFTGKSRGIAYVDFSDEIHLHAAVSKNKQKLLGLKLSIARSDPKRGQKKASSGTSALGEGRRASSSKDHDHVAKESKDNAAEKPKETFEDSKEARPQNASASHKRGGHVRLVGRNTFAVPRTLARPLGWGKSEQTNEGDDKPKSNEEFRDLLLKK